MLSFQKLFLFYKIINHLLKDAENEDKEGANHTLELLLDSGLPNYI